MYLRVVCELVLLCVWVWEVVQSNLKSNSSIGGMSSSACLTNQLWAKTEAPVVRVETIVVFVLTQGVSSLEETAGQHQH